MRKEVKRKERKKMIAFYVSDDEKNVIADAAYDADMSVSDYCRKVLLGISMPKQKLGEVD